MTELLQRYTPMAPDIFVAMAKGVGARKCHWQHSTAHSRKPLYRRKNFADISYTRRVIAHFVPNFVAMATRESPG